MDRVKKGFGLIFATALSCTVIHIAIIKETHLHKGKGSARFRVGGGGVSNLVYVTN